MENCVKISALSGEEYTESLGAGIKSLLPEMGGDASESLHTGFWMNTLSLDGTRNSGHEDKSKSVGSASCLVLLKLGKSSCKKTNKYE